MEYYFNQRECVIQIKKIKLQLGIHFRLCEDLYRVCLVVQGNFKSLINS